MKHPDLRRSSPDVRSLVAPPMNAESFETLRPSTRTPFAMLDAASALAREGRSAGSPQEGAPADRQASSRPASATTIVRDLSDADCARWDAFVMAAPDATFFHRSGWREVVESCSAWALTACSAGSDPSSDSNS